MSISCVMWGYSVSAKHYSSHESKADEPVRLKVWKLTFEGNKTYTSIVLSEIIALEGMDFWDRMFNKNDERFDFVGEEAQKDAIRIERFYQRRGFADVKVELKVKEGTKKWQRIVTFKIQENEPILIEKVNLHTEKEDSELILKHPSIQKQLKKPSLRIGRRLEIVQFQDLNRQFVNTMQNLGFPYSQAEISAEVDSVFHTAAVTILLKTGIQAKFGKFTVQGNKTVDGDYVLNEGNLKSGIRFSQSRLSRAQQELFNHPLFGFVTITFPKQEQDSVVSVLVRVRENPLRIFSIRGGVGTEEIVRSEISWTHLNPFGNAHNITFKTRGSLNSDLEVRQARAAMDYNIPYLFNTKSGTQTTPFAEYRNEYAYNLSRFGINNAFIYQHSIELQSTVAHEFSVNELAEKSSRVVNVDSLQLYNISAIQLGALYRKGFFDQNVSWFINPFVEFSGFLGTGSYSYSKFYLDIRRYLSISRTTQLAIKANTGFILARSADYLPAAIRLYAGGTSSVRGWLTDDLGPKRARLDENGDFDRFVGIGGKASFAFSLELRKKTDFIFRRTGFALFVDGGQVWTSLTDASIKNTVLPRFSVLPGNRYNGLQYAFGGGISYDTPIGPLRFDVAYKINPTEADLGIYSGKNYGSVLSRWGIHFSLGNPF